MTFDPKKPYGVKAGNDVRIICTDRKADSPIVALVTLGESKEALLRYNMLGQVQGADRQYDLINIPEEITGWVNVYRVASGQFAPGNMYASKEAASVTVGGYERVACVEIKAAVGDGLD
ncbi:MAG: hypothetical protein GY953_39410 [bacterium]|nr:hypothetical protein [bacterium]